MRIRSLSVAILTGLLLVPAGAPGAFASDSLSGPNVVTGSSETFKTSSVQRAKRVARAAAAAKVVTVTAPRTSTPTTAPVDVYSARVATLTNTQRTSRGLRALSFSGCADGYANTWATALARSGSLSHQALSPILTNCGARGVGENVAYGNVTPEQLVQMWMDSPGHRANILNPAFTHIGVGDVTTSSGRVYGVQVFLTL